MTKIYLYVALGAAALSVYGAWHYKVAHDAREAVLIKIEKEKSDAIRSANEAREHIRNMCDRDPVNCVPFDWFRR